MKMSSDGLTVLSLILAGFCGHFGWHFSSLDHYSIRMVRAVIGFIVGFGLFGGILFSWFGEPVLGGYERPIGEKTGAWPD
jgi:hypothetical protein